jgi:hypothetical protein
MNEVSLKKLWTAVSVKYDIGTYNEFKIAMSDNSRRKKFYDMVTSKKMDIGTFQEFENRIGVTSQTPPPTSEDFPPCAIKKGKVRKTPSGADVIVYKTTIWDKPNVQLYSKINRFVVLGGSEKGKMGNYKCTESGKLFLELDSEKKVDPNNKKQGLTSTNLTSDDILNGKGSVKIGMKGNVVGEIQNLLISKGFKEVSKTGNADNTFGPLTDKMVREFQTKNELTVDGIVGPNTWSKLSKNSVETKTEPVDMSQPVTTPGAPGYKAPLNLDVNRPNTQLSEIKKIVSKNLKSLIK